MEFELKLIPTEREHLISFYEFQLDAEANRLAAFTAKGMNDKTLYLEKYTRFLSDPTINMRTIVVNDIIAGSIAKFVMENEAELTYWIDKKFWGKGVASNALREFLEMEQTRPIYGRTAFDNYGSQKVLEKCGFVKIGVDKGFANARQKEIEEYIYVLQ